jgi:mRNA interferase RelE/StbE
MAWKARLSVEAERQFAKLDRPVQVRLAKYLRSRLETDENPRRIGEALKGRFGEYWKYRVGDYRLICDIDDASRTVWVLQIGDRKEVYR